MPVIEKVELEQEKELAEYYVTFPIQIYASVYVEAEEGLSDKEIIERVSSNDAFEAGMELGGYSPRDIGREALNVFETNKERKGYGLIEVEEA